jgi:hypothetical protein
MSVARSSTLASMPTLIFATSFFAIIIPVRLSFLPVGHDYLVHCHEPFVVQGVLAFANLETHPTASPEDSRTLGKRVQ